jgi:hypothetical protein
VSRRRDFVRKVKPTKTPLRFASHRRQDGEVDEEEADSFDDVAVYEERVLQRIIGERLLKMDGKLLSHHEEFKSHDDKVLVASKLFEENRPAQNGKAMLFPCYYEENCQVCV